MYTTLKQNTLNSKKLVINHSIMIYKIVLQDFYLKLLQIK